jgi:hypothetical protein
MTKTLLDADMRRIIRGGTVGVGGSFHPCYLFQRCIPEVLCDMLDVPCAMLFLESNPVVDVVRLFSCRLFKKAII